MKHLASLFVFILLGSISYVFIPADVFAASSVDCQCVLFLRQILGVDIHGNSWTIKANEPMNQIEPGDVLLFSYAKTDHVALITDVIQARPERPEIYVTIRESNYHKCTPDTRTIPLSDPAIRGIYRPQSYTQPVIDIAL